MDSFILIIYLFNVRIPSSSCNIPILHGMDQNLGTPALNKQDS